MAAMAKFSWDRELAIHVLKVIINRNRENQNRAANKVLALAGQPKRRGRPPKRQLEETEKPIELPTMPPQTPPGAPALPRSGPQTRQQTLPRLTCVVAAAAANQLQRSFLSPATPGKPGLLCRGYGGTPVEDG